MDQLAQQERAAARTISLGRYRWVLLGVLVVFFAALFLPHSGDVRGIDLIARNEKATADTKIGEFVFVYFGTAAAVVLNAATLLTRRTAVANIQYLCAGVALLTSLFGLWMRMQDAENTGAAGIGPGLIIEALAVIVLVYAMSCFIFARSEEQKRIAHDRASTPSLDAVGKVQQEHRMSRGMDSPETNPLLVDDRRRRAAERHSKPEPGQPRS